MDSRVWKLDPTGLSRKEILVLMQQNVQRQGWFLAWPESELHDIKARVLLFLAFVWKSQALYGRSSRYQEGGVGEGGKSEAVYPQWEDYLIISSVQNCWQIVIIKNTLLVGFNNNFKSLHTMHTPLPGYRVTTTALIIPTLVEGRWWMVAIPSSIFFQEERHLLPSQASQKTSHCLNPTGLEPTHLWTNAYGWGMILSDWHKPIRVYANSVYTIVVRVGKGCLHKGYLVLSFTQRKMDGCWTVVNFP